MSTFRPYRAIVAKLKIIGDGTQTGTSVWVGDQRLEGVQVVDVHMGVGEKPTATLIVRRPELHLDGEFETLRLVGGDDGRSE